MSPELRNYLDDKHDALKKISSFDPKPAAKYLKLQSPNKLPCDQLKMNQRLPCKCYFDPSCGTGRRTHNLLVGS